MKKIDEHYIAAALAWLILGLVLAILARMRADELLDITSALAVNTAFPFTAFAGLLFRFFPLMKQSKLAKPQFWILNSGLVIVVAGAYFTGLGYVEDLVDLGMVIALGGAVLLALIWWRERAPT